MQISQPHQNLAFSTFTIAEGHYYRRREGWKRFLNCNKTADKNEHILL
jgi:hypothetical protein